MTRANLVGAVAIVIAIVFGAPPVSAQRHVGGHGRISGLPNVPSMRGINNAGRRAVPRATLPPRVATIHTYRPLYPRYAYGYPRYRHSFPLYRSAYPFYGGYGYAFYGYPYRYGYAIPLSEYGTSHGGVRLEIPQDHAEVYVDGYYAGTVDDFDGRLQELQLEAGQHRIEVREAGYEPLAFDVNIQGGRNIVYHQTLQPDHP